MQFKDGEKFDPVSNKNHYLMGCKLSESGLEISLTRDILGIGLSMEDREISQELINQLRERYPNVRLLLDGKEIQPV